MEAMASTKEWVRMDSVSKVYPNGTTALQEVDLSVREGEFLCFVGPSGCGKSTVFKLITGLSGATGGTLEVMGTSPQQARKQSDTAFVFQDHTLLPWSSVVDNVSLPLALRGMSRKQRREEAEQALELVGLKDYVKAMPRQLSGGMKMRVSIARALVSKPKLLLMDEPFGALDEITRQTLQLELLDIWSRNKEMTVLFVTHNVFEAVFLSTRVVVMTPRPGKVAATIDVPVPFPRDASFRTTPRFGELVRSVSEALKH
ncbi:ABC transporter ATP-binding protein [Paenibacillus pasadenensis]|uniref:ABC-type nitrate/sulfonate/bicarbonate transport system, ATPase component n=1 Tax=Paenibacillus pasadenensis TaxID=217090 RepID=A0A2N5N1K5_9BACL|nr:MULTISPECIES: ABC transporter ATP-binding protein [Paenibacillus]PLT44203.1 ABC-type nitrate/sulfonate/bicarbonate transport system, ATPase component [Paenibacillus pasadenensis]QGG54732.1 ATP-binding cassette domain-containing protein [Paenibacillus sp. B01]